MFHMDLHVRVQMEFVESDYLHSPLENFVFWIMWALEETQPSWFAGEENKVLLRCGISWCQHVFRLIVADTCIRSFLFIEVLSTFINYRSRTSPCAQHQVIHLITRIKLVLWAQREQSIEVHSIVRQERQSNCHGGRSINYCDGFPGDVGFWFFFWGNIFACSEILDLLLSHCYSCKCVSLEIFAFVCPLAALTLNLFPSN